MTLERSVDKCVMSKQFLHSLKVMQSLPRLNFCVNKSRVCLILFLYLRMNQKINTPRYRQRATLHISCHHLQVWDHKSTPPLHWGSHCRLSEPYIKHALCTVLLAFLIYCTYSLQVKHQQKHLKIYSPAAPVWKPHCPNNVCPFIISFLIWVSFWEFIPTAEPREICDHREGEADLQSEGPSILKMSMFQKWD